MSYKKKIQNPSKILNRFITVQSDVYLYYYDFYSVLLYFLFNIFSIQMLAFLVVVYVCWKYTGFSCSKTNILANYFVFFFGEWQAMSVDTLIGENVRKMKVDTNIKSERCTLNSTQCELLLLYPYGIYVWASTACLLYK